MRIGILGPSSQLGSSLRVLVPNADLVFKNEIDLLSPSTIRAGMKDRRWDYLINCAAITDVDYCQEHESDACTAHVVSVKELAEYCKENSIHLIQISTDFVFDGSRGLYTPNDQPAPVNVYGATKLAGERAIQESGCRHTIIRTSSLFGEARGRTNLIEKIIDIGLRKGQVTANPRRILVPTSTKALAQRIVEQLREGVRLSSAKLGEGTVHSICGDPVSQFDLAQFVFSQIPSLSHVTVKAPDREKPTFRPLNSSLVSSPGWALSSWQIELSEYLTQKGYSRPLFVQEVEADAAFSVSKVWERLGRKPIDEEALIHALRADRTNFLLGKKPKPGKKKSIKDLMAMDL